VWWKVSQFLVVFLACFQLNWQSNAPAISNKLRPGRNHPRDLLASAKLWPDRIRRSGVLLRQTGDYERLHLVECSLGILQSGGGELASSHYALTHVGLPAFWPQP